MKMVVGLGNPGPEYQLTRHNAGVMLVDKLAEKLESDYGWRRKKTIWVWESGDKQWKLVKTAGVFMNESGRMMRDLALKAWPCEAKNLVVAHDDLDIALGEYKIQFGTGPKEHNGIKSIEAALKTKDFWRIRLGVDNRPAGNREAGEEYVLKRFTPEERLRLDEAIEKAISELMTDK